MEQRRGHGEKGRQAAHHSSVETEGSKGNGGQHCTVQTGSKRQKCSKAAAAKRDQNTLVAKSNPGEEASATLARTALRPSINAAVTIKEYAKKYGDLDLMSLVDELSNQARLANEGDLKRAEAMLTIQAHTLDAIFNNLAQRANGAEYMDQ
jgi:hypothetical protein